MLYCKLLHSTLKASGIRHQQYTLLQFKLCKVQQKKEPDVNKLHLTLMSKAVTIEFKLLLSVNNTATCTTCLMYKNTQESINQSIASASLLLPILQNSEYINQMSVECC
jgi:hypothetical protein